jgi:hypothetical protein
MSRPTVFLSYCRRDEVWKDRIANQLRVLGDLASASQKPLGSP